MDGLVGLFEVLLQAIPPWFQAFLAFLIILAISNKLLDGKPLLYIVRWFDKKLKQQDKRYDAVHAMLRESIDEQAAEYKELIDSFNQAKKGLGEGQASLMVKNSETRQLIRGMNVHLTRQHELLSDIIKNQEILEEKLSNYTIIMMNIERRINDDG